MTVFGNKDEGLLNFDVRKFFMEETEGKLTF